MKNELAVRSWAYDDNLIRTVKLNEEAWFVGKDAAKALGYSNTRDALANHVDEEDKNTVAIRDVLKREQNTIIINESEIRLSHCRCRTLWSDIRLASQSGRKEMPSY